RKLFRYVFIDRCRGCKAVKLLTLLFGHHIFIEIVSPFLIGCLCHKPLPGIVQCCFHLSGTSASQRIGEESSFQCAEKGMPHVGTLPAPLSSQPVRSHPYVPRHSLCIKVGSIRRGALSLMPVIERRGDPS